MQFWASLVAQMVKCLPAMRETRVQSLGREDLLEKEMATHSNTLAWKIPWTEEPGRLQSIVSIHFTFYCKILVVVHECIILIYTNVIKLSDLTIFLIPTDF